MNRSIAHRLRRGARRVRGQPRDFRDLVEGQETYLAAKREWEIKQLMGHDAYKRVHGRIRQVRHA